MLFRGDTLDDVLLKLLRSLLSSKRAHYTDSSRGTARELVGVLVRVDNPLARISIASLRSQLFSSLGELFWYLSGDNRLDHIKYYVRNYADESVDDLTVPSGYGPRLYGMRGINQVQEVTDLLKKKKSTRRAVIQILNAEDIALPVSPPCTCFLQFIARKRRLHAFVSMRSNDAYLGLPHDLFAFSMIQELIARELGLELGSYTHAVGSMHLYSKHDVFARRYVDEGFQERVPMPSMPAGSPWNAINELVSFENQVRTVGPSTPLPAALDDYWIDIARLLAIYGSYKSKNSPLLDSLKSQVTSRAYSFAIERRSRQLRKSTIQQTLFQTSKLESDHVPAQ